MTPNFVTKVLKNPYFCSAKTGPQEVVLFLALEVVLFLTLERPKSGPTTNSPADIYIYIYAVGSITWPHFGHFKVNNLATVGSTTWPPFFEPIKLGFWGDFLCTILRGWCKISVFESCFLVRKEVFERKNVHLFLGEFRLYFLVAA